MQGANSPRCGRTLSEQVQFGDRDGIATKTHTVADDLDLKISTACRHLPCAHRVRPERRCPIPADCAMRRSRDGVLGDTTCGREVSGDYVGMADVAKGRDDGA